MPATFRLVLGILTLISLLVLVFHVESSTMVIEYYVYEITSKVDALDTKFTIKLVRLDNETFKVELLHVEPENMKVQLEHKLNMMNWTLKLEEAFDTKHYFLYLPEAYFQPYIDIELIGIGCEKAREVEKLVRDYLNPGASAEQRLRLINLLRSPSPEVFVISWLVGDPYNSVGLRAYTHGIKDAHYELTATCRGSVYTFSYRYSFRDAHAGCEYVLEATSRYSTTGWLVNARFTHRRTCKTGDTATTRFFTFEQKLVETSNKELKAHAFSTQPAGPGIIEALENPVTVLIATAVVAIIAVSVKLARARK